MILSGMAKAAMLRLTAARSSSTSVSFFSHCTTRPPFRLREGGEGEGERDVGALVLEGEEGGDALALDGVREAHHRALRHRQVLVLNPRSASTGLLFPLKCHTRTSSISAVPRRWPLTLMTSSRRPVMRSRPSSSRSAPSPVRKYPSGNHHSLSRPGK